MQLIDALKTTIDGVVRGAISFSDVKIISHSSKCNPLSFESEEEFLVD